MNKMIKKIVKCDAIFKFCCAYIIIFSIYMVILVLGLKINSINENYFNTDEFNYPLKIIKDFDLFYNNYKFIIFGFLVFSISYLIVRHLYIKNSIEVLEINSLKTVDAGLTTKYLDEEVTEYDFIELTKVNDDNPRKYSEIVSKIDIYASEFLKNKKGKNLAFVGILHTPFALRLGNDIGDGTKFKYFHKKRDGKNFELLTSEKEYVGNYAKMNSEEFLNDSDELVVTISTTFKIEDSQLNSFDLSNKNYIKFETTEKNYDVIKSEKQINEYKKYVLDNIRRISREKNIKKIHLCIASSVAFTFALGQNFSSQYDPKIIIYNYSNQKYNWGIDLFEKPENCIVINS